MWDRIARFVLQFRLPLLLLLFAATALMGYFASQVEMSYEFSKAIPTDNPKYQTYLAFQKKFGDDGNLMVLGVQTNRLFELGVFNSYIQLSDRLKQIPGVDGVLGIPTAVNLKKNDSTEKLQAVPIFRQHYDSLPELTRDKNVFFGLPFYRSLLYNPSSHAYLMLISVNKEILSTKKRDATVDAITQAGREFGRVQSIDTYFSGLPLIRTHMATKVAAEMKWFLFGSVLLSAVILLIFFRSFSAMLLSLVVVGIGVISSMGTIHLLGYKITLLNAVIPPLVVVIGVPNCIYFLNKFHTTFQETQDKRKALAEMIRRMGIVTLFCNITAAIGFGVFALTASSLLKEFGVVAGLNILGLFFISMLLIPSVLSYLPDPRPRHMRYLTNKWLSAILSQLERWALNHRAVIYSATLGVLVLAVAGMTRLRSETYIVDDLPKSDRVYTDLKFFEQNFQGIMPLEIVVDTKRKNGLRINPLRTFQKMDSLSSYIASMPDMARPLSVVELLKFARQGYYSGDSANYGLPNEFDITFLAPYLSMRPDSGAAKTTVSRLASSFIDSNRQQTRISVNMADIGSQRLPRVLDSISQESAELFDSTRYRVHMTGSTVTFLEGSIFIISGLKQSILWAFVLIAACMLYLFKSLRILLCSLLPNLIPLVITAGVMGWAGVPLKPSTVIVFSIALGISIDITIRFLVNYKQVLTLEKLGTHQAVISTIYTTGISIVYTSLVLIAGFVIFCFSSFGGIFALGWLTSLTLVMATLTNLIFLPALLLTLSKGT